MMPEEFEPNYKLIEASEIWIDQIAPMLDGMYRAALEEQIGLTKEPIVSCGVRPTLEDYHYWRGFCAAIKAVRDTPANQVEANRAMTAQMKEDDLERRQQSEFADYRRRTA